MPDVTGLQPKEFVSDLDEIARERARRMLIQALAAGVADYIDRNQARDESGRSLVVRNGKARPRKVTVGSGTIEVRAPRVDDRRESQAGTRHRFRSQILPPYMRRSPKVAEVLPILYLRGLSTGDFKEGLTALLGEEAAGLSHRRPSPGSRPRGKSTTRRSRSEISGSATTSTSGPTVSTSASAWRRIASVPSC